MVPDEHPPDTAVSEDGDVENALRDTFRNAAEISMMVPVVRAPEG